MFQGKMKALTFSYDDGVLQDQRLIELFNKYNLKATFNLNSELLGTDNTLIREGVTVLHNKVAPADVRYVYDGHEVAVHTLTHPNLTKLPEDEVIRQVEEDRLKLSELAGYEVIGMAYPCGGINNDKRTADILRQHCHVRYARGIETTLSFEPYPDLMQYHGTLYSHVQWNHLFEMGEKFLALQPETPQVFYIWGHAYEFDIYPERWGLLEEFFQMMSGQPDIFYGTNREVLLV